MPDLPQINVGAVPDDDKINSLVRQLNEWGRAISTESHVADYGQGSLFIRNNQLVLVKPSGEEIIIAGQQDQNTGVDVEGNFKAIQGSSIEADSITADQISSLNFSGKTATFDTGSIGGFDLGEDYIRDSANTMGMASTVTGGDDVRFWAGDSFENRATAPFRVTEGGSINATDIKIAGQVNALEPLSVTGVEPDINAAITEVYNNGGGTVTLRSGTYSPTTDILLKSGVNLIGEKESTTIIDFDSNSASIKYEDDDVYTTGTITSITSGVMVEGSGTSWLTNASAGQYLFLQNRHYQIAVVTSDTTLILAEGYIGNATLPGASYRISTILTDVDLAELTIKNSADDGLTIRGGKNITLKNMTYPSNNVGIDWDYVTENKFESVIVVTSTSDGVQMTNVGFGDARGLASVSNGGHGFLLNNIETMPFQFCASNANTSDGVNATSVTKSVFNIESRANGGQGVEYVSGCSNNIINSSLIANNTSDGVKLTATNDNNLVVNSILEANGGYGINIAASSCDDNILSSNQYISNSSGDYSDSGTGTTIIDGSQLVTSVNTQTGDVVLDQDDVGDGTTYKQYSATEKTKLAGIETGADVTDATNVDAAGATMNTDTSLAGNGYFLDEDTMSSDSATKVASQQSIKAYVDTQIAGVSAGLMPWTEVTGTSQSASINNGYITNNAGLVTVTIPTTAAVGSIVEVAGKSAGGWKVAQNASEIIHFGSVDTTTGTGGSLASTNRYDSVRLICIVADTEWLVLSSVGNITVV